VVRGASAGLPRNEALLLFAVLNHSWLLDVHAEELAELPFLNREAAELRRVLLDAHMEGESEDEERLATRLKARNLDGALTRVRACAVARHDWPAFADAGRGDVELWWHQRTALHRRAHALSKELREAEKALADDPTEMNWARFLDVQKRLAALDGTEALVEGFGAASGRPARSM
jgi:DNA primase